MRMRALTTGGTASLGDALPRKDRARGGQSPSLKSPYLYVFAWAADGCSASLLTMRPISTSCGSHVRRLDRLGAAFMRQRSRAVARGRFSMDSILSAASRRSSGTT